MPGSFLVLLAATAVIGWCFYSGILVLPDRHNPWAPLQFEEPPGWLTRFKLERMARNPALCRKTLDDAGVRSTPLPDRTVEPGCGFRNAFRLHATGASAFAPAVLSCDSAVSLALWERHVLQPASERHLGARAVRIEHFGSYACRNVGNRADGRRSRHAVADALDVSAVVLSDGRRISVAKHWAAQGVEAEFLRALHAGACRVYDAVLGPGYNAAHRDHLHLERGGSRVCR